MNQPDVPTTFMAHLTTSAGTLSVTIALDKIQLEVWGVHEGVPWMAISDYFTKGTVTQSRAVDGTLVIVNWSQVISVTYDNPWANIPRHQAIKFGKNSW